MVREKKQQEIPGTETDLSLACDRLIDTRNVMEEARAAFHEAEKHLISVMSESGKKSIKHDGRVIRYVHIDAKDKIQVQTDV